MSAVPALLRVGDLIEATKGETVLRGRLQKSLPGSTLIDVKHAGWSTASLDSEGWTITVIERGARSESEVAQDVLTDVVNAMTLVHQGGAHDGHVSMDRMRLLDIARKYGVEL